MSDLLEVDLEDLRPSRAHGSTYLAPHVVARESSIRGPGFNGFRNWEVANALRKLGLLD